MCLQLCFVCFTCMFSRVFFYMYFFPPALLVVLSRTGPDITGPCGMQKETPDGFPDARSPSLSSRPDNAQLNSPPCFTVPVFSVPFVTHFFLLSSYFSFLRYSRAVRPSVSMPLGDGFKPPNEIECIYFSLIFMKNLGFTTPSTQSQ